MKEKYIFFILLLLTVAMLVSTRVGKKSSGKISAEEQAFERSLKRAGQRQSIAAQKIDMQLVQDVIAFSDYERMLKKSLFFQLQPERPKEEAGQEAELMPVDEQTPLFVYRGKIAAGNRVVVIIEQTRSGEVAMVSKGESIAGYKVLDITDTEVILSKKDEKTIILKTIEGP